jgi:amidohydrolase
MLRADLDALPIRETKEAPHRSANAGAAHLCGHDGHMTILAGVGEALARERPARGRAILLYQPAEETGEGAAAVLDDPGFVALRPDFAFALHNLPGYPLGQVVVRDGAFASASRGMTVVLEGVAAHAAQPETGRSPAGALARIIGRWADPPLDVVGNGGGTFITVVGSRLGTKSFGTAPDRVEIWATLRGPDDQAMADLVEFAERVVVEEAGTDCLVPTITYEDVFPATVNAPEAVAVLRRAAPPDGIRELKRPFRWSEDFGRFTAAVPGALFGLGAGEDTPALHNPDYDFPDALTPLGRDLFLAVLADLLG